ncbi:SPOR domain-containing protein [Pedobacter changchengzhani]|uniref:SPOR domain-containing protein n=1 Tax=Pedobacter changchengzhani TaxID=2529274 RepID=A0A4V3A0K3_9SPHI|nr:SPOR domain-containing protein [Pedobacter changchengzhani]TDG37983.1 SPOR domain-containing protein [Pedobacter changchengzhani]
MRILFTFLFLITLSQTSFAQKGAIEIVKDPIIDSLIAKRLELYRSTGEVKNNRPIVSDYGYRVQVFYDSDRREVFNQQARFKNSFPGYNTYITYKEPNYYIRVGDFRTRMDAQRLMNEIRPAFPTLFIFREKINAPTLDITNDDQR